MSPCVTDISDNISIKRLGFLPSLIYFQRILTGEVRTGIEDGEAIRAEFRK